MWLVLPGAGMPDVRPFPGVVDIESTRPVSTLRTVPRNARDEQQKGEFEEVNQISWADSQNTDRDQPGILTRKRARDGDCS